MEVLVRRNSKTFLLSEQIIGHTLEIFKVHKTYESSTDLVSRLNFTVLCQPGLKNVKPDALSRLTLKPHRNHWSSRLHVWRGHYTVSGVAGEGSSNYNCLIPGSTSKQILGILEIKGKIISYIIYLHPFTCTSSSLMLDISL